MPEIMGLQMIVGKGDSYVACLVHEGLPKYKERYGVLPATCWAGEEAYAALTTNRNLLGPHRDLRIEKLTSLHKWSFLLAGRE